MKIVVYRFKNNKIAQVRILSNEEFKIAQKQHKKSGRGIFFEVIEDNNLIEIITWLYKKHYPLIDKDSFVLEQLTNMEVDLKQTIEFISEIKKSITDFNIPPF